MGGCRCSYKTCKSATKTTENLHFFHYPVRHAQRCAIWIKNADKPEFSALPADQLRNKVICGLHFEDKYFTNVQKKRLVHDAIPTLDEGCEEDLFVKEIEILPTSIDGSTFTLQADHLQPGPSRNEQKLGFRNGKMIIHRFENTESEVYTINPSYIQQSFYFPNSTKDVFVTSNSYQNDSNEASVIYKTEDSNVLLYENNSNDTYAKQAEAEVEQYVETHESAKTSHNLYFDEESESERNKTTIEVEKIIELIPDNDKEDEKPKRNRMDRNVLRRINMHAQEIASIKRCLAQNRVKTTNKSILRMLKGRVPDSLLGALSLHLCKHEENFNADEKSFLNALCTISPNPSKILRAFGWYIPNQLKETT